MSRPTTASTDESWDVLSTLYDELRSTRRDLERLGEGEFADQLATHLANEIRECLRAADRYQAYVAQERLLAIVRGDTGRFRPQKGYNHARARPRWLRAS